MAAGFPGRGQRGWRRLGRVGRSVAATVLGPVLAVTGLSLPAAAMTVAAAAGVTAAAVATAAPAKAATGLPVLVVKVNGESTAPEAALLTSAGYSVTQDSVATLESMSQSAFQGYAAVVIGDPSSGGSCPTSWQPTTGTLGTNWEGWVDGDVAVLGTAPVLAASLASSGNTAADTLISDTAGYAAAQPGSTVTKTGLYLSLDCAYSTVATGTSVPVLSGVEGIGAAGGVTVNGSLSCSDSGTVNSFEADAAGTFGGFTSSSLAAGAPGWPSPGCPVQEAFDSWPAMFTPVAYDTATDATANFTASDGATGQPYVLLGAPVSAGTASLSPANGGEVPAGTTAGGAGNPSAGGVTQALAAGSVNTEDGDLTQADDDVSIPTFGPALGFSRSYDSGVAQQETEAAAPGNMGYGWTDNWAASLTTGKPVPGDIYTIDGKDTYDGNGWVPTLQAITPDGAFQYGGDTYIADTADNRVEEIAGATETEWGVSMTSGHMYTIAGNQYGTAGQTGNGTAAASTYLNQPGGLAVNSTGLYIADTGNCRVIEIPSSTGKQWGISMTAGDMYVIAGENFSYCGDGTDATVGTSSELYEPSGVAFGAGASAGSLYIADSGNNRVQELAGTTGTQWGKSMTADDVYTAAGWPGGSAGDTAPGGVATSTQLDGPESVAVGSSGSLFIADTYNCRVLMVAVGSGTAWGQSMTANDAYTLAGSNLGDCGVGGDAKVGTSSELNNPEAVWDGGGNLYIADAGNNRIQEIAGTTHTEFGQSMTSTYIYTVAGSSAGTAGSSGDGGAATSARLNAPGGVWVDGSGDLYVADTVNNRIREVSASTSDISTLAGTGGTRKTEGDGGPAVWSGLYGPFDTAFDGKGDLFIADTANNRVQEVPVTSGTNYGIAMTEGDVYTIAGSATGQAGDSGNGGLASSALLSYPEGLTVDAAGNVYIADTNNAQVREVSVATGDISTVAGSLSGTIGSSGDNGPATSALLGGPAGLAVDGSGNVYLTDITNANVREIAGATGTQHGVSMTKGDIYDVAGLPSGASGWSGIGGAATSAELVAPTGIALDSAGNVYITDNDEYVALEVPAKTGRQWGRTLTANDIYIVAGKAGAPGSAGDGGPATSAGLYSPQGIAVDPAGDLYIVDSSNGRIQEVAGQNGSQWSQSMTAGDVYTVAGVTGTVGDTGDGGPALAAEMEFPMAASVNPDGDLFIADQNTGTVREVVDSTAASGGVFPAVSGLGVTVTQADGSQVTFYPQGTGGTCAGSTYTQVAGGYCTLPQDTATLTYNSSAKTYTFVPSPGSDTDTFNASGQLTSEIDTAGNPLTLASNSPAPGGTVTGNGTCPTTAASCQTVTSAGGRALILGYNGASDTGQVTSVTDPMNRTWTYGYTNSDLTSVTDPMSNKTSYTYGKGVTSPLLANDLTGITAPNAQSGGPDAGDSTAITYNGAGQVTTQTDPMAHATNFYYCINAATADCMDSATGTGLVTVTDPDGNQTVYDYDQGTLAAQSAWTDTTGGLTLTSENDSIPDTAAASTSNPSGGTLLDTSATDGDGHTTTTSYNADGNPTSATSPAANGTPATTTTAYTASLQDTDCASTATAASTATCTQDPGPAAVAPDGVITPPSSAPPVGVTWDLYDTRGNELYSTTGVYEPGATTAAYSQTTYQLFQNNSVTLNGTTISCTTTSPAPSLPCAKINADGVVTQLKYNSQGDLISSSTPDGNGSEVATTTYTYDADGEQTLTTAPDGNLAGANAGNYTTTAAYNADGQKASFTLAGGSGATVPRRTTSYGYDADGNQTTVKDPRGYTTTTTYNADDKAAVVTNPDSDATLTCYNGDGNVAQTVPAVGVAANTLTAASCPTAYPAGYGTRLAADATVYTFNALGFKTQKTTPAPAGQSGYETTSYTYDGNGNLLTTTSPPVSAGGSNQATVDTYDAAGDLASQTIGHGTSAASTVSYCYDASGDKTAAVYADGDSTGTAVCSTSSPWTVTATPQESYETTYSYDSLAEMVSTTTPSSTAAPDGATTSWTYDAAGNVLTTTDPDGVVTTWTLTPSGMPASESFSRSAAHSVSFSYDADGNKTSMTDATGTSSYVYDSFRELTSTEDGAGQTTSYGYNADGKVTSITYPMPSTATWATGDAVSYGYDSADELTSVTDFNGHSLTISNTADGLADSEALGSSGDTVTATYDPTDNPSSIALKNSSSTLESFSYSDAPAGEVLSETDTPTSSQSPADYTYDGQGRVASMTPGTGSANDYSFDASSNLITLPTGATGTYNDAGELTSSTLSGATTDYTYNSDGEELASTQGSTTESSASWNGAGETTGYANSSANMTAASYDGDGMRASTTITPSSGTAVTQDYVWSTVSQMPQLIMDSANAYIYADSGTPTEQVNLSTGSVTYLVGDALGSVRGTVNSSGTLTATASYDAWGNPLTGGGLTATTQFGYAGGYTDPDGLIYLLNRYYEPPTGQFLSVDPELSRTGQPYEYADGNPVSNTDPTGKQTRCMDWTCGYEFNAWASWSLAYTVWGIVNGIISVASAGVCALFQRIVGKAWGGYLCGAIWGTLQPMIWTADTFPPWTGKCFYGGIGLWKTVGLWTRSECRS